MPRPVRRPSPITLPHYPMDTLWEVDESLDQAPSRRRSEEEHVSFPLPPRSLPMKRFFKMSLPMHSPPRTRSPPKPTRAPPPVPRPVSPAVPRPVSPSSSASSDTEPPRTPPAAPTPLPAYVLSPPPPAEWESAIDALFDFDEEEELSSKWSSSSSTPRASPVPIIRPTDSYLSFSPPCSPPPISYMHSAKSPLPPSMSAYASDSLPMSPSFNRPLASPGLMPTSPTSPGLCQWPTAPTRPARSSKRMGTVLPLIRS